MSLREQILKTIDGYIEGFNTNTPEGSIAHRSADCKHRIVPDSPHFPVRTNDEYRDFISPSFKFMNNFHLQLLEGQPPIVDEVARKGVIHLTSTAGTPIGEYKNSYIFTFQFSEDGREITDIVEFVDTHTLAEFVPRMLKFIQENAPESLT